MYIYHTYSIFIFNILHQLRVYTLLSEYTFVLNFNFYCHQAVGQEWDAVHLYIEKNIDFIESY